MMLLLTTRVFYAESGALIVRWHALIMTFFNYDIISRVTG